MSAATEPHRPPSPDHLPIRHGGPSDDRTTQRRGHSVRRAPRPHPPRQRALVPRAAGAGRAQRGDRAVRRPGLRRPGLLRRRDSHPPPRRPGGRRPPLQQLSHHHALLAVAGLPADGSQPPRGRHAHAVQHRLRVAERPGAYQPPGRPDVRSAARRRLQHLRRRQVARGADASGDRCRPLRGVAPGAGLQPVLRLHERCHRPLPPRTVPGQPRGGPSGATRRRLPPHRGPRGPGYRLHRRPHRPPSGRPFLLLRPAGGRPLPPPRPGGVHGSGAGSLRRRLGRRPPRSLRAPAGRRRHPFGHRTAAGQPWRAAVGIPQRSRAAGGGAPGRGLCRLHRTHRRRTRSAAGVPERHRAPGEHAGHRDLRQRGRHGGGPPRDVQRHPVLQRHARGLRAHTGRPRRHRRPAGRQPLRPPAGRRPRTRPDAGTNTTPTAAGSATP